MGKSLQDSAKSAKSTKGFRNINSLVAEFVYLALLVPGKTPKGVVVEAVLIQIFIVAAAYHLAHLLA